MELRNRNFITIAGVFLSFLSFIVFVAFLGAFKYSSFDTFNDSFAFLKDFDLIFSKGIESILCGVLIIASVILLLTGLITIALLKRKINVKITFIIFLLIFCFMSFWSALTLYGAHDEIIAFLSSWQISNYAGVTITAFHFMIASFISFLLFSLFSLFFMIFVKQTPREKTIEEIVEVEEIVDEPEDRVVTQELFPAAPVKKLDVPEEKIVEKKVESLKQKAKLASKPIKNIDDEDDMPVEKNKSNNTFNSDKKSFAKENSMKNNFSSTNVSFLERLDLLDSNLKDSYDDIKKYIESYGIKSRIAQDGESFRLHKVRYFKIAITGKKLKVYFHLNPRDYQDSSIPFQDVSSKKKYEDIPLLLKVGSPLSVKSAKQLIDETMENANIQ